jgi:molecular chaperone GrpE (heat shock protein)
MNDDYKVSVTAASDPELPTMGMSSVYRLFEAFIALREKNQREHKMFEQTLNRARDGLQTSFNSFAGDTQKAYQQLRQDILGEKKFSLTLLNVLLDLGIEMNHILDSRPKHLPKGEEGEAIVSWMQALEVQNRKIWDDIRKFGIHLYEAPFGVPYNPGLHERVGSKRVDGLPALMIAETVEKGYASQQPEFILRRPKVIVTE